MFGMKKKKPLKWSEYEKWYPCSKDCEFKVLFLRRFVEGEHRRSHLYYERWDDKEETTGMPPEFLNCIVCRHFVPVDNYVKETEKRETVAADPWEYIERVMKANSVF